MGATREDSRAVRAKKAAQTPAPHQEPLVTFPNPKPGRDYEIGSFPSTPPRDVTLRQTAIEGLLEGCVGEGAASLAARLASEDADGTIAVVLREIAADELSHAQLGWATVGWALRIAPDLAPALQQALVRYRARPVTASPIDPALAEFGLLDAATVAALERELIDAVIAPTLNALCDAAASATTPGRDLSGSETR